MSNQYILVGTLSVFLVACADSGQESAATAESKAGGVIPKHQLDTLNRAKSLDDNALDADEKRRKQLEAMQ